jgi:ornithine cyclodeaminase/alanine dehydrogenase-like protein (mu-crystallin family)
VHKKIAILGLEPMHHVDLQFTTDLTEALRTRAKTGIGAYELAPDTNRELIDEKLLNNCDNEETGCMSAIGAGLGADVIMYGRVELGGGGYAVTLKILDVNKKRVERSLTRTIPFPDRSEDAETRVRNALDIAPDAQRMYWDLTKP